MSHYIGRWQRSEKNLSINVIYLYPKVWIIEPFTSHSVKLSRHFSLSAEEATINDFRALLLIRNFTLTFLSLILESWPSLEVSICRDNEDIRPLLFSEKYKRKNFYLYQYKAGEPLKVWWLRMVLMNYVIWMKEEVVKTEDLENRLNR